MHLLQNMVIMLYEEGRVQSWNAQAQRQGGLFVCQCGREACEAGHQYGPAVRDHFLIHFVASGRGTFWTENAAYPVEAGQGFCIFPGQVTTYRASGRAPWTYSWVGYAGLDAALLTKQIGIVRERPVFDCPEPEAAQDMLRRMMEMASQRRMGQMAALGMLYQLLAQMGEGLQRGDSDVYGEVYQRARWYMEGNYERPISVEDVAAFVGLSRSQLYRVFQRVSGTSPKESLTEIRLNRARMLLEGTALTADAIAASVGIGSAARLGVLFRQRLGTTMRAYRERAVRG